MQKTLLLIGLLALAISCKKSSSATSESYIYLSHTRVDSNDSIYSKLYDIDFTNYDMTLLGGDLALSSFSNPKIMTHLDSVFDVKNPNTLWSIGNHDKTSAEKFHKQTGRNKYHAYQKNDVTFITLDSQDSLSSIVGKQKEFLFSVLDTLKTSSVLLMSHKLIFMNDHPLLDSKISKTCNRHKGDCYHCHNANNFQREIYPELLKLKNKGVQVIWLGGDLDYRTSEFNYEDEVGIVFLGNGMWYKKNWNKVLLFSKQKNTPLAYNFVHIDTLLKN